MGKIILISLLLVGCACNPEVRIEYIKVPPKTPPVITRPQLDTDYIKSDADAGTVIQAHRLTIKKLQQWGLELDAAINAYRTPGEAQ